MFSSIEKTIILNNTEYISKPPPNKACSVHPTPGRTPGLSWWDCHFVACAFSGNFCGSKLVPSKLRYLVPPTSTPQGHKAHRWAASIYSRNSEFKEGCHEDNS